MPGKIRRPVFRWRGIRPLTLPVPGFKTVAQVEDDVGTLAHGPLPAGTMATIERALGRVTVAA